MVYSFLYYCFIHIYLSPDHIQCVTWIVDSISPVLSPYSEIQMRIYCVFIIFCLMNDAYIQLLNQKHI